MEEIGKILLDENGYFVDEIFETYVSRFENCVESRKKFF